MAPPVLGESLSDAEQHAAQSIEQLGVPNTGVGCFCRNDAGWHAALQLGGVYPWPLARVGGTRAEISKLRYRGAGSPIARRRVARPRPSTGPQIATPPHSRG